MYDSMVGVDTALGRSNKVMTNTSPNLHDNAHIAAQSVQAYLMSAPRVLSAEWWTLLSLPGPGPRIVC